MVRVRNSDCAPFLRGMGVANGERAREFCRNVALNCGGEAGGIEENRSGGGARSQADSDFVALLVDETDLMARRRSKSIPPNRPSPFPPPF